MVLDLFDDLKYLAENIYRDCEGRRRRSKNQIQNSFKLNCILSIQRMMMGRDQ